MLLGTCAIMAAAACADAPTAVEPSASAAALERNAAHITTGRVVEVVCSISYATPGGPYDYQYGRVRVKLPAASRAADGSTRQYRFRNHAGTRVVGAANCTIPATKLAAAHLDRFFGVKERGGRRMPQNEGGASLMSDEHTLPTLEVKACQHGGDYPLCDPEPIDWDELHNPPEQQVCHTDCGGGGGDSGGSTSEPPAEEEEPETPCKTNDPMINSQAVQDAFQALWQASNATAGTSGRREQGGWIVKNADGSYGFQAFSDVISEQCSMRPTDGFAPNPPSNAVGWVHTHPFTRDELMGCVMTDPATGMRTVPRYPAAVSRDDVIIGDRINARLAARGLPPIIGIVLDTDGIKRFQSVGLHSGSGLMFPPIPRCGY